MTTDAAVEPLLELARRRDPKDRERLMARLVELCEAQGPSLAPSAATEVEAVFMALVEDAERDIRARLAERLARAEWAPPRLIETLAADDIEVARPIIAASPLLQDEALLRLLVEATLAHRIEVARRPRISAKVVAAVIERGEPAVLTALAANASADVTPAAMARLVDRAKTIAALGAPLAAHPRMTAELAQSLYLWVGQALRQGIVRRFDVDAAALNAQIAAVMSETPKKPPLSGPTTGEAMVVDKLASAGQLRPGYLVRVLKEHQLGLFEAALAKLGGFSTDEVHRAVIDEARPEVLALAVASVGVDRSAFPTILEMVRQCTDGLPGGGAEGARRAISAFGPFAPDIAASAFRQALAPPDPIQT
ncbi:MAG TPA: DUF2336 domain-containing protein [Caulobacteraceae bacterium]|nr:DUF2336 domain-containing protein [Caulobacteraceae bacterium]